MKPSKFLIVVKWIYLCFVIVRNNWIRLKRYLVIDFTISMLTVGSNPEDIDFTFENLSGAFFTGVKKKLLPALGTSPAQSNDEHSYDMRQFYMHYERELLYRIIEMRCEVVSYDLILIMPFNNKFCSFLGNDSAWTS